MMLIFSPKMAEYVTILEFKIHVTIYCQDTQISDICNCIGLYYFLKCAARCNYICLAVNTHNMWKHWYS